MSLTNNSQWHSLIQFKYKFFIDFLYVIIILIDSSPLARHRLKELKGLKKTFFNYLEEDAKKGNKTIEQSLRYFHSNHYA